MDGVLTPSNHHHAHIIFNEGKITGWHAVPHKANHDHKHHKSSYRPHFTCNPSFAKRDGVRHLNLREFLQSDGDIDFG
ncbi:hypothetical protein FYJ32_08245 [Bifidobacterium tsurumiense]|nr:hypothetical protein [Bifidobacterium tsurumiense]